jgi:uncharacterized protein DUF2868
MDEQAALDITAVRAVETTDGARTLWTDADRAWAGRAAAEVVGEGADDATFVTRRARLALERLGERHTALPRAAQVLRWRPWVGWALVAAAFAIGAAADRIGGAAHINLLAPPVFGLLVWNIAVYAALAVAALRDRAPATSGGLRRLLIRAAGGTTDDAPVNRRVRGEGGALIRASIAALAREWSGLAAPLYAARAARTLHLAAAALALGVIAGLYVRGLAFEYRATWESTFLDAPAVRALLAIALAPGALVTGIAVPDVTRIAAIRAPASENAAMWLNLLAATVAAIVVVPRLLLAMAAGLLERHRAARIPVPLAAPYFQRLLRGFRGGRAGVEVIPYSYTLAPAAFEGLRAVVARAFEGGVALTVAPAIAYGDEARVATMPAPRSGSTCFALFNVTATPEPETYGAFLAALAVRNGAAEIHTAIVDESAWRARWPGDAVRLDERRAMWKAMFATHRVAPVFVDLAAPDLAASEAAVDAAFAAHDARDPAALRPT